MAVESLFPSTLGCNGIDGNRLHAEATEAAQAAWGRTVAANERNEREADARSNAIKKLEEVSPRGGVLANGCTLPDGTINYISPSGATPTDPISQSDEFVLLGGRETDAQGNIPLKKISGALPVTVKFVECLRLDSPLSSRLPLIGPALRTKFCVPRGYYHG